LVVLQVLPRIFPAAVPGKMVRVEGNLGMVAVLAAQPAAVEDKRIVTVFREEREIRELPREPVVVPMARQRDRSGAREVVPALFAVVAIWA
jgi:hypothetical protein